MRTVTIYPDMREAVAQIQDGATLMIPGFGPGTPWNLMKALYDQGTSGLTLISNNVGFPSGDPEVRTVADFVASDRVAKVIASFTASPRPSRVSVAEEKVYAGTMQAEAVPQGTLAERIRAGAAGIPAFYTPTAVGTLLAEGREVREFNGRKYLLEEALFADVTFVRAWKADELGNLIYRRAARNYNPVMAMAARTVIVEVEQPIVRAGELDPDHIHTPGVYVTGMVQIPPDGVFVVDRARSMGSLVPDANPSRQSS
jgi:3-oxoacid CoA-transferase A subunit